MLHYRAPGDISQGIIVVNHISVLNSEEEEKLIAEFKAVYKKNGKNDLASQVPYLSRLAEHYEATATVNKNDWVSLLKVCNVMCLSCSVYRIFSRIILYIIGNCDSTAWRRVWH